MSTRALIATPKPKGTITGINCVHDGGPPSGGHILKTHYPEDATVAGNYTPGSAVWNSI